MKEQLRTFIHKLTRRLERDRFDKEPNPIRAWMILLGAFFAAFVLVGLVHVYLFYSLAIVEPASEEPTLKTVINRVLLDKTLDFYEDKEKRFNRTVEETPDLADPSL